MYSVIIFACPIKQDWTSSARGIWKGLFSLAGLKIALDLASRQALLGNSGPPKKGLLPGDTRALVVQSLYRLLGLLFLFSEYWLKYTG